MKRALAFTLMVLAIMIIAVSCEEPQAHVHTYSEKWECDENYHWHEATCGDTDEVGDKEAHKFGNLITDTAATESTAGKGHRVCSVCDYKKEEEIPVLGHSHKLSSGYVSNDPTGHWQTCSGCSSKVNFSAHDMKWVSKDDINHDYKCSVCGYVDKEKTETHSLVEIKDLTTGEKEQSCKKCSYKKTLAAVATATETVTSVKKAEITTVSGKTEITIVNSDGTVSKREVANEDIVANTKTVDITAKVTATAGSESATTTTGETKATTVSFPEGALKMEAGKTQIELTVTALTAEEATSSASGYQEENKADDSSSTATVKVSADRAVIAGFEFKLSGAVASDLSGKDSEGTQVTTYIAKGLAAGVTCTPDKEGRIKTESDLKNIVSIQYIGGDGKQPVVNSYRDSDGELVFTVYHFSKYAVIAEKVVATDNKGNMYTSLEDAAVDTEKVKGAISSVENGGTVTLLKNVAISNGLTVSDKALTLNLNGKVLSCGSENERKYMTAVTVKKTGDLTIKNGKISYYGNNGTVSESGTRGTCHIIENKGTLTISSLQVSADLKAACNVTMSNADAAISDDNSCPEVALVSSSGTLRIDSTTLGISVALSEGPVKTSRTGLTFAGIKPLVIYLQTGSDATLDGSTITATTSAPGGVLGLYALVGDNAESGITAKIEDSTITLTNNSFGWTRPVFADGRDADKKVEINITGSSVTTTDTLTDTQIGSTSMKDSLFAKQNRAYGLRALGNAIINADQTSLNNVKVNVGKKGESGCATKIVWAGELTDKDGSAQTSNVCGKVWNSSTNEDVGVMTAKDKASLEKDIKYAKKGATIQLLDDIDLQLSTVSEERPALTINKSLTIDGDGHKLYNDSEEIKDCIQMVTITGMEEGNGVTLKDITVESKVLLPKGRAIQIENSENATITLDKVTVSLPDFYGIYVVAGCNGSTLNITNGSKISAWSAIYNHSSSFTVMAAESEFVSVNRQTGGGESNSFSGILVSEYYNSEEPSINNSMTFTNCTFTAKITDQNTDVKQQIADLRNPCGNTLTLKNCTFNPAEGSQYFLSCYDSTYKGNTVEEKYKGTNKIIVNDEDISFSDKVTWYLDADSGCKEGVYHIGYKNTENASLDVNSAWTNWYFRYESEKSVAVTLPVLTKTGYTFGGWYTDETFTESNKKTEIGVAETGHFTLYAKWTSNDASV